MLEEEAEKKRKSLTGRKEIRPACSQTCDRGFGKGTSWGGEFLGRRDGIREERKQSVQRKMGHIKNESRSKLEETEADREGAQSGQ